MIVVEQIDSAHLTGNLIGDPSVRDLVIYLPPGYEESDGRYPTAYLLHGFGGKAMHWLARSEDDPKWSPPIDEVLDPLIRSERAKEMIVVMPDGWSRFGCSQWVDSPVNGNFEQYVTEEVVSFVDEHFRTMPAAKSRGIFGISSGGLGAWHLGSRHPDLFGAMALLSADSYFDLTHLPWIYKYYNNVFPGEPNGPVENDTYSQLSYGLASCYSPNAEEPPYYVDLPVAFPSGTVLQDVWDRWLEYDPVVSWKVRVDALKRLRGILLDVGYRDEYDLHYGHRLLSEGLSSAGIAHEVREHAGTHTGRLFERIQMTMSWFSEVLHV